MLQYNIIDRKLSIFEHPKGLSFEFRKIFVKPKF